MKEQKKGRFFTAQTIAQLAILIACFFVLRYTSLGYITVGPISATTLHIPVLIGAVIGGWRYGLILGIFFGLDSFLHALQGGSVLSFLFLNPLISIGCRAAFGFLAGLLAERLRGRNPLLAYGLPAFIGSLLNTVFVMGMVYLLYAEEYGQAMGLSAEGVQKAILSVCLVNGLPESLVASLITLPVCTALDKAGSRPKRRGTAPEAVSSNPADPVGEKEK